MAAMMLCDVLNKIFVKFSMNVSLNPKCHRIIVPLDLQFSAMPALTVAVPLGSHHRARLILLTVIEQTSLHDQLKLGAEKSRATAVTYKKLEQVAEQFVPKSVSVKLKVCHGNCPAMITSVADQEQADLIVLATSSDTGLGGLFGDSIVEQVVRHVACPVCVMRLPSGLRNQPSPTRSAF
jgi:nucleotide-binding universal stress UspA family protein